jgi:hypothetical protein
VRFSCAASTAAILIKDHLRAVINFNFTMSNILLDLDKDAVKFASNRIFPENINTEFRRVFE